MDFQTPLRVADAFPTTFVELCRSALLRDDDLEWQLQSSPVMAPRGSTWVLNQDAKMRSVRFAYLSRSFHERDAEVATRYGLRGLDEVCVAVRHRQSGQWRMAHAALQRALSGAVSFGENGEPRPKSEPPGVGDALFFATDGDDILTSALVGVERPTRQTIGSYPV